MQHFRVEAICDATRSTGYRLRVRHNPGNLDENASVFEKQLAAKGPAMVAACLWTGNEFSSAGFQLVGRRCV